MHDVAVLFDTFPLAILIRHSASQLVTPSAVTHHAQTRSRDSIGLENSIGQVYTCKLLALSNAALGWRPVSACRAWRYIQYETITVWTVHSRSVKTLRGSGASAKRRRRLCLRLFVSYFNLHNLAMKNNGFNNVHASYMGACVVRFFSASAVQTKTFRARPRCTHFHSMTLRIRFCMSSREKIWNLFRTHLLLRNTCSHLPHGCMQGARIVDCHTSHRIRLSDTECVMLTHLRVLQPSFLWLFKCCWLHCWQSMGGEFHPKIECFHIFPTFFDNFIVHADVADVVCLKGTREHFFTRKKENGEWERKVKSGRRIKWWCRHHRVNAMSTCLFVLSTRIEPAHGCAGPAHTQYTHTYLCAMMNRVKCFSIEMCTHKFLSNKS